LQYGWQGLSFITQFWPSLITAVGMAVSFSLRIGHARPTFENGAHNLNRHWCSWRFYRADGGLWVGHDRFSFSGGQKAAILICAALVGDKVKARMKSGSIISF